MGIFGNPIKVKSHAFRGGFRYSKIGKKLRTIPKELLSSSKKRELYETLAKRKRGGLTKYETQGVIRELIDNKDDSISRSKAIKLKKHLEKITGYEELSYSDDMAYRYSHVDKSGRIVAHDYKEKESQRTEKESSSIATATRQSEITADTAEHKEQAVQQNTASNPHAVANGNMAIKKSGGGFFDFFTRNRRKDSVVPVVAESARKPIDSSQTQESHSYPAQKEQLRTALPMTKTTQGPYTSQNVSASNLANFLMGAAANPVSHQQPLQRGGLAQDELSTAELQETARRDLQKQNSLPETVRPQEKQDKDKNPSPDNPDNSKVNQEDAQPQKQTVAAKPEKDDPGDNVDPGRDVSHTEAGFYVKQTTPFTNMPNINPMSEPSPAEHKILAVVSVLVSDRQKNSAPVNEIITTNGHLFLGRMGLPLTRNCTGECTSVIVLVVEAPQTELNSFLDKFTTIEGVVAKAIVMPGLASDPARPSGEFHGIK